jgi:hypothetical protein
MVVPSERSERGIGLRGERLMKPVKSRENL